MLICFIENNEILLKEYMENNKLVMENITKYEYNIYNEIIFPEDSQYLIKITSNNGDFSKFFNYQKNYRFIIFILDENKPLIKENISIEEKDSLVDKFFEEIKINKAYIEKKNLIRVYEMFLEDISFIKNNHVNFYTLSLKIFIKN
jgi:hypothetical protein